MRNPYKSQTLTLIIQDGNEKVVDASTSTSTSSDYMGPSYNHRVSDPYEYFDGIFAVSSLISDLIVASGRTGHA
jgi:hypothetical protein